MTWRDSKIVSVLYTVPDVGEELAQCVRRVKTSGGTWATDSFPQPKVIQQYNAYMGRLDYKCRVPVGYCIRLFMCLLEFVQICKF